MTTKSMMVRVGADTKDMERGLTAAQKRIKTFRANINKIGKSMMVAGVVVAGAVGMIVKKASDFEEAFTKFGTVFQSVIDDANMVVKDLTKNYGLSKLAATEMLSATGDLLVGLGMQGEAALSLSERTQKLSIDLASFTNFSGGAKGASDALTKAMLGERESVKALGIVITEEMVKEHLLKEGKEKLTGMARLQARAEATLAIAISQSGSAMGDYQRTAGGLANTMRRLMARVDDLWVALGERLVPVFAFLADEATNALENIQDNTGTFTKNMLGYFKTIAQGVMGLMLAWNAFALHTFEAGEKVAGFGKKVLDWFEKQLKKADEVFPAITEKEKEAFEHSMKFRKKLMGVSEDLSTVEAGFREEAEKYLNMMTETIIGFERLFAVIDKSTESLDRMEKKTKKTTKTTIAIGEAAKKGGNFFLDFAKAVGIFAEMTAVKLMTLKGIAGKALDLGPAIAIPDFTLAEEEFESFKDFVDAWKEALVAKMQTAWEVALEGSRAVVGALDNLFGQFHENEAMRIENEEKKKTDAIESWYEREREKIEATITNEEEKVAALEALDEEKARKENALQHKMDLERRKLARTQAKREKATALFSAGINLAEAITKVFAKNILPVAVVMAAITSGLIAIQIGAIAAAPLPALAKGGRIGIEGGIVGEQGAELFMPGRPGTIIPLHRGAGMVGAEAFTFSPTVNIYTKTLDDYTISRAAEKIFARLAKEKRRFGG